MRTAVSARLSGIGFGRDRRAVAAMEFALVMPLLILVMAGAFELSRATGTARRLTSAANAAATMLATNTSGSVTYTDLHYAADSMMVNFPAVLRDSATKGIAWGSDITIALAGISFPPTVTGCTSSCTYKAKVVWTGGAASRACGSSITSVAASNAPSATTLPSDLYTAVANSSGGNNAPPFAVVVDVAYSWAPLVFARYFGALTIQRSAYISPRYVTQIAYSQITGDDGFGRACP